MKLKECPITITITITTSTTDQNERTILNPNWNFNFFLVVHYYNRECPKLDLETTPQPTYSLTIGPPRLLLHLPSHVACMDASFNELKMNRIGKFSHQFKS